MNECKEMMVSVVCQTYNHEKFITECLKNLVNQKVNFCYEILVHDDASTDKTADIIRKFEREYPNLIKPIYQSVNQWSAGNKVFSGIQLPRCTGKYIAICEGDDYWTDLYKLQKQVDLLEQHSEYSMCFHNAIEHWSDGQKQDCVFSNIIDREYTGLEVYTNWMIPTASVVFRRSILVSEYAICFQNPHFIYGDIVLFLLAASCGKIVGMSDTMSVYRRHTGGMVYAYNASRIIKSLEHHKNIPFVFGQQYKTASEMARIPLFVSLSFFYLKQKKYFLMIKYLFLSSSLSIGKTFLCIKKKMKDKIGKHE